MKGESMHEAAQSPTKAHFVMMSLLSAMADLRAKAGGSNARTGRTFVHCWC